MSKSTNRAPWETGPVFVFTSDIDWASEACIADLCDTVAGFDVVPTAFVTHASSELSRRQRGGSVRLEIHPNFLPGSSHGDTPAGVIDHVLGLVPDAACSRSHAMYDSSPALIELVGRGIRYDSNLALYLQSNLVPLEMWIGIPRFPIFWGDDIHWRRGGSWDFSAYAERFFTPGLKILSVHPFMFALNIPDHEFYEGHKPLITRLDAEGMQRMRHAGGGVRTFVLDALAEIRRRGHGFTSLDALYRHWRD
ncbi:MAG: hypothetical protein ACM31L_16805 [Actinomycetota bacterium]